MVWVGLSILLALLLSLTVYTVVRMKHDVDVWETKYNALCIKYETLTHKEKALREQGSLLNRQLRKDTQYEY